MVFTAIEEKAVRIRREKERVVILASYGSTLNGEFDIIEYKSDEGSLSTLVLFRKCMNNSFGLFSIPRNN